MDSDGKPVRDKDGKLVRDVDPAGNPILTFSDGMKVRVRGDILGVIKSARSHFQTYAEKVGQKVAADAGAQTSAASGAANLAAEKASTGPKPPDVAGASPTMTTRAPLTVESGKVAPITDRGAHPRTNADVLGGAPAIGPGSEDVAPSGDAQKESYWKAHPDAAPKSETEPSIAAHAWQRLLTTEPGDENRSIYEIMKRKVTGGR